MKILIDGVIRDMTEAEEEAFYEEHANLPTEPKELSVESKAEAYDILMGVSE